MGEILILIAEHDVHHMLSPQMRDCSEKARLAQVNLIALAIVSQAVTPIGT